MKVGGGVLGDALADDEDALDFREREAVGRHDVVDRLARLLVNEVDGDAAADGVVNDELQVRLLRQPREQGVRVRIDGEQPHAAVRHLDVKRAPVRLAGRGGALGRSLLRRAGVGWGRLRLSAR